MEKPPIPPDDLMAVFRLNDPVFVEQTGIARVWKVQRDGQDAALKVYDGRDMRNEAHGFDLIYSKESAGAVHIWDQTQGAVVMEWLEGPSLGDLARRGEDEEAAILLGEVAATLFAHPAAVPDLPTLDTWISDLLTVQIAPDCSPSLSSSIGAAQVLARALLRTSTMARPLHGDLHHDNVRRGARGWCAFDAKGVLGDPTYELANAFRNPVGCDDLMRQPARIRYSATLWAGRLNLDRARLLRWAAVKCALSICWRSGPVLRSDEEADLLAILLSEAIAAGG